MTDKRPILLFSSAIALTLTLQQGARAELIADEPPPPGVALTATAAAPEPAASDGANSGAPPASEADASEAQSQPASTEPSPPAGSAPVVDAPATEAPPVETAAKEPPAPPPTAEPPSAKPQPPSPPARKDAARERMEQRRVEMSERRNRRYEELRARAAEFGLELPEAPPWKLMSDEERKAHREKMGTMSPEQRSAMREQHWEAMRDRARERGVEMPETPPWKQAEERREEMKARWESYKETLNAMTPEQKEAIQALFGQGQRQFSPPAMSPQMPRGMPTQAPFGQQQQYGFPSSPGIPGYGSQGAGPSLYQMGRPGSWQSGQQPAYPGPAPHWPGRNEGWLQGPPAPGSQ